MRTSSDRSPKLPQFKLTTPHQVIAGNASSTPVLDWQRPLDGERVLEISRIFNSSDEIMPNAVLLAVHNNKDVTIRHESGDLWTIEVDADKGKPVWILDGQHRIAGLSKAKSKDKIPFVLLASHGASAPYSQSTFAKIFAQVTTTAEGLHPLHDEWLTYAFRLGKYDVSSPKQAAINKQHANAMAATVALCHERFLDTAQHLPNPFFDKIAFNPGGVKRTHKVTKLGPPRGGSSSRPPSFRTLSVRVTTHIGRSRPAP